MTTGRRETILRTGRLRRSGAGAVIARPAIERAFQIGLPPRRLAERIFRRLRNMFQYMANKAAPQPNDPAERSRGFRNGDHRKTPGGQAGARCLSVTGSLRSKSGDGASYHGVDALQASIRTGASACSSVSAHIVIIPPALAQSRRFAGRYIGMALEGAAFPGHAPVLNDGCRARFRSAEAAQRIAGQETSFPPTLCPFRRRTGWLRPSIRPASSPHGKHRIPCPGRRCDREILPYSRSPMESGHAEHTRRFEA